MSPHPDIRAQPVAYRALRRQAETLGACFLIAYALSGWSEEIAWSGRLHAPLLALAPKGAWLALMFGAGVVHIVALAVNHGRTWTLAVRAATLSLAAAILTIIAAGFWLGAPPSQPAVAYSFISAGLWGLAHRSIAEIAHRVTHHAKPN